MPYLDTIKEKRQGEADASSQQAFVNSITQVSADIRELLASLETSGAKKLDTKVVEAIGSLNSIVGALQNVVVREDQDMKAALANIADILETMDIKPIVNVKAPQVTVQERKIDFDPLIAALNSESSSDDDPLATYKAQDINSDDPHVQYVGFVNPSGNWYIIENNDITNSLRYKFGKKGYAKAFKDAAKLNYKLYSEAIREIKT